MCCLETLNRETGIKVLPFYSICNSSTKCSVYIFYYFCCCFLKAYIKVFTMSSPSVIVCCFMQHFSLLNACCKLRHPMSYYTMNVWPKHHLCVLLFTSVAIWRAVGCVVLRQCRPAGLFIIWCPIHVGEQEAGVSPRNAALPLRLHITLFFCHSSGIT